MANACTNSSIVPVASHVERDVLGIILSDAELLPDLLAAGLRVSDFFHADHRTIFTAILALDHEQAPVNVLTVEEKLGSRPSDFATLCGLLDGCVVVRSHVLYLAKLLRKKAELRGLLKLGQDLVTAAEDPQADPYALRVEFEQKLNPEVSEVGA